MKNLAGSLMTLALLFLILYSFKSHSEISRLRAQIPQGTQPVLPIEDSHPGRPMENSHPALPIGDSQPGRPIEDSDGQSTQAESLDATGSPSPNRAKDTSERRLNDFLTLVDRCDLNRNFWRSPDTLMSFRLYALEKHRPLPQDLLPQEESVVFAVDQALRELRFEPLRLDVKLHRYDKTKSSLDHMDVYESRYENTIRIKTIPEHLQPTHVDSEYFERTTINHAPEDSLVLEISVQPKGVYQHIYDKWPRRRQRQFREELRAAAEQAIADLAVAVRISVQVWNSSLQGWD